MHPAQEVLWSASLAKSCFSTTISPNGSVSLAMPLAPGVVSVALRGKRAFFLSLAHRDTFVKKESDVSSDTPGEKRLAYRKYLM